MSYEIERALGGLNQYNDVGGSSSPSVAKLPSLKTRIAAAVVQAEERLRRVQEAKEIFERNPDLERLLNIMQQNHF